MRYLSDIFIDHRISSGLIRLRSKNNSTGQWWPAKEMNDSLKFTFTDKKFRFIGFISKVLFPSNKIIFLLQKSAESFRKINVGVDDVRKGRGLTETLKSNNSRSQTINNEFT